MNLCSRLFSLLVIFYIAEVSYAKSVQWNQILINQLELSDKEVQAKRIHLQKLVEHISVRKERYKNYFGSRVHVEKVLEAYRKLIKQESTELFLDCINTEFTCFKSSELAFSTGYFSPVYPASLKKDELYQYPLYLPPKDLKKKDQRYSRKKIDSEGVLKNKSFELVYLKNAFDVYLLHVQGSALLKLPNGDLFPVGVAATNGLKYTSIGKVLVETGAISKDKISLKTIRQYLAKNPDKEGALLMKNERYIFFQKTKVEPMGSTGTPVQAYASIAVDRHQGKYALPPLGMFNMKFIKNEKFPLKKTEYLVFVQDTGSAIQGGLRLDLYLGVGSEVGLLAGELQHHAELYFYWPKGLSLPKGM